MPEHVLRQRCVDRHEHRRPDDRVEADDFLADEVHVARPVAFVFFHAFARQLWKTQSGDVVGQRIEPHVDDVLFVERHRNSPVEAAPGNTQVFEPLVDKGQHLVDAALRLEEIRRLKQLHEAVGVVRKPEEIRFFLRLFHGPPAVGTQAFGKLVLCPERLAGRAVPADVFGFVNVTLLVHLQENLLHALLVPRLRRADKVVVGDLHRLPQLQNAFDDRIDVFLRLLPPRLGQLLNLLTVLVGSRQEHDVAPRQALKSRHGIGHHRAIRVTDVEVVAGVVNGRGDVKRFSLIHDVLLLPLRMRTGYRMMLWGSLSPSRMAKRSR